MLGRGKREKGLVASALDELQITGRQVRCTFKYGNDTSFSIARVQGNQIDELSRIVNRSESLGTEL